MHLLAHSSGASCTWRACKLYIYIVYIHPNTNVQFLSIILIYVEVRNLLNLVVWTRDLLSNFPDFKKLLQWEWWLLNIFDDYLKTEEGMKFRKNKQGLEKKRSPNSNAILSESSILSPFSFAKKSSANVLEPIFCGNRWASLPKEPVPSGPSSRVRRLDSRWNLYRILSGILKNVLFKTGQEIVGSFSFTSFIHESFHCPSAFPKK